MIDPQRLRDLADALQGCEWEVPLGSEQLCRDAAEEVERLREEVALLSSPARISELLSEFNKQRAGDNAGRNGCY